MLIKKIRVVKGHFSFDKVAELANASLLNSDSTTNKLFIKQLFKSTFVTQKCFLVFVVYN